MPEAPVAYWPMAVYFVAVVLLVSSMLGFSYLLGERPKSRALATPYESGIMATGSARVRLSNDFYLFAMFFVIFDLESVFVFSYCLAVRELGWIGYGQILIFIGVVAASLAYLWRLGALESTK